MTERKDEITKISIEYHVNLEKSKQDYEIKIQNIKNQYEKQLIETNYKNEKKELTYKENIQILNYEILKIMKIN